ncbi:T9SS type A sorting domain-containing protein [Melioribacter sp. Ez-97]|uniref:T9SS type A sorting domain-containing protein n=1 Tax=Melioribacter sp. Ez-97 TaxID=3423434 RepID=UPI003EDB4CA7
MKTKTILSVIMLLISYSIYAQQQLSIGVAYNLTQDPKSTVRYQLDVSAPCELRFKFQNWVSTYNWGLDFDRLYVYNSSLEPIGIEGNFTGEEDPYIFHMMETDSVYITRVGKAGTYYIDIHSGEIWNWPQGQTTQSFTLIIEAIYAQDQHEPNDEFSTATRLSIGNDLIAYQWRYIDNSYVYNDEDYYKIDLPSPGRLKLEVVDWSATYNWGLDYDRIYVYNQSFEAIGSRSGNDNDPYWSWMLSNPEEDSLNFTSGGTYYLRFHSGAGYSTTPYKIKTEFTPVNDIYEPNDDISTAAEVELGKELFAYQWKSIGMNTNVYNDEDYYKITIPDSGTLTITIKNWEATVSWVTDFDRLYLYDLNGNPVGASGSDPYIGRMMYKNPYTLNVEIPSAGAYYIRLHSGNGISTLPYSIRFDFEGITNLETEASLPTKYELKQNYPNPFNPVTKIKYELPERSHVKLTVYNSLGEEVSELINKEQAAGSYEIEFDGSGLPSGIYYYTIQSGAYRLTRKMILLK